MEKVLQDLLALEAKYQKEMSDAGDRRDWDAGTEAEEKLDAIKELIKFANNQK